MLINPKHFRIQFAKGCETGGDRDYLAAGVEEALRPHAGVPPCVPARIGNDRSPTAFVPSSFAAVGRQIGTRSSPKRTPAAR